MNKKKFMKFLLEEKNNGYDFILKDDKGKISIMTYEEIQNLLNNIDYVIKQSKDNGFNYLLQLKIQEYIIEYQIGLL